MKNLLNVMVLALATGFSPGASGGTNINAVVAIAPWLPPSERDSIARATANLLTDSPTGTRVTVIDAGTLKSVAQATVGDGAKRIRQQRSAASIVAIVSAVRAATNELACFNAPVVLDHISRELRDPTMKTLVVLAGPALYRNPKEPAFDMTSAWPSDGHLAAGNRRSVFSTADRLRRLDGVAVSWLVTDTSGLQNEGHRDGVTRFWSLFVGTQGGKLISYSPDVRTVFARIFEEGAEAVTLASPAANDASVIMHSRAIERAQRATITNAPVPTVHEAIAPAAPEPAIVPASVSQVASNVPAVSILRSLLTRPPAPVPTTEPMALPTVASGDTGIGIVWEGAPGQSSRIDLDLYVQPPNGGPELFFGFTNSAYGHFYRDMRQSMMANSGDWQSLWEFVELRGDQLPQSIWINFYSGTGSVDGEVRVQHRGRVFSRPFTVAAREGSRGRYVGSRASDPAWVQVQLAKFEESAPVP
jgi:hypothetical protein